MNLEDTLDLTARTVALQESVKFVRDLPLDSRDVVRIALIFEDYLVDGIVTP